MEILKLLNLKEMVVQLICFLTLLAILRYFLWGKFLSMLDNRKKMLSDKLENIERTQKSLDSIKDNYVAKIAAIDEEAGNRIARALAEANKLADEIRAKAEIDAEKMIQNAKESIRDEISDAKESLKNSITDLTIEIAGKVIQEKLSEAQDRKLVEEFIDGIDKR